MDKTSERILRARMHGLYLTRKCDDIVDLSRHLLGLHCWFHRNVAFSAIIRGASLMGWKHALTKTWIHTALHGVAPDDLSTLLAVNSGPPRWDHEYWGPQYEEIAEKAISLMEDGVFSRSEMRIIFSHEYDPKTIDRAFSPWGGIFVELARQGRVAFRSMVSRDFDLIDATPTETAEEVLPRLFRRYIASYGPATLDDASRFFGLHIRKRKKEMLTLNLDEYSRFEHNKSTYYYIEEPAHMADIPEVALLSGFDPLIVSYVDRSAILPPEYRTSVILKSGICLPTIAINGQVAGIWNIKNRNISVEFFSPQPQRIIDTASGMAEAIRWQTSGAI